MNDAILLITVFVLSFVFALGGVGSATAIIPILVFMGTSFNMAKSTGLFINTLSSSVSTYHHHQSGKMEWKLALFLATPSLILAPAGAVVSQWMSHELLLVVFSIFLIYSATVLLLLKKEGVKNPTPAELLAVGSISGFFAGLLGIGGGSIIAPILALMNVNPKRIARLTPFAVLISSLSGFFTYASMGFIDLKLLAIVSVPALVGGYMGAHMMHHKLSDRQIRYIIGIIFYLLAAKAIITVLGI